MKRIFGRTINTTIIILAATLVALSGCSTAPPKPEPVGRGDYEYVKQYISRLIEKEMKSNRITGLSIALVDDQTLVWAEGFGYADKENKVPASPQTVYGVGSISKLFTATAAMQLAEQGRMDIDRPLQTYLPQFSIKTHFGDAGPITPRTIMTHHSGLPSNIMKGMWNSPEPFTSVVDCLKDEYVAFPPNFIFSYSNIGVTLLGHAIQNVTGRDFAGYMDEELLRPMNMALSGFAERPAMKPFLAKGYIKDEPVEEILMPVRDLPAGALRSTVLDLSQFMQMVFAQGMSGNRRILKPETLAQMLSPQNNGNALDLDIRNGLGWFVGPSEHSGIQDAGTLAGHGGAIPYFNSQLMTLPEHKLGVAVLSNSATSRKTVDSVAVKTLQLALEAKTGIRQNKVKKPAAAGIRVPQQELRQYEGWYATVEGPLKITAEPDGLETELMRKTIRLVPLGDGWFGLQYKFLGLIPVSLGALDDLRLSPATVAGREIIKGRQLGGERLLAEKIKPVPVPAKWLERLGGYEVANPGDDRFVPDRPRLRYADGILFFDYLAGREKSRVTLALLPVSDDEAVICGLVGQSAGETIRAVDAGASEALSFSGYLYRKKSGN